MLDDSRPRPVSSAEPYRSNDRRPRPSLVLKTVSPEVLARYLALPETQKAVSSLVRSLTADRTPAHVHEDIAQEAYVAALSAQSRPRSPETMKAWLKTLVRRAVCDYFRKGKRDETWLKPDQDVEEQPAEPVDPPEDAWLVHDWLKSAVAGDELDTETFEMLTYRARMGRTDREVAEDHGLTYAAWTNRLSRFKKKIRRALRETPHGASAAGRSGRGARRCRRRNRASRSLRSGSAGLSASSHAGPCACADPRAHAHARALQRGRGPRRRPRPRVEAAAALGAQRHTGGETDVPGK